MTIEVSVTINGVKYGEQWQVNDITRLDQAQETIDFVIRDILESVRVRQNGTLSAIPACMALNARQESFARLMAVGTLSLIEAYRQAGYSEKGGSDKALVPGPE